MSRAMLFQWGLANRMSPVRLLSAVTSSVWRTLFLLPEKTCEQKYCHNSAGANPYKIKRHNCIIWDACIFWRDIGRVHRWFNHYNDVIMSAMASQITGVSIVCSSVDSGVDRRKHQSSASLAFVRGIHRWPVNSPHKRPVTRQMFPFDDVIMISGIFPIIHPYLCVCMTCQ